MSFAEFREQLQNFDVNDIDFEKMGVWPAPAKIFVAVLLIAVVFAATYYVWIKDLNMQLETIVNKEATLKESFRKKFSNLKKLLGWKKAESEAPILSAIKNLEAIHMEASKSYIIKPYPGEIHLLKARIPTYYIPEPVYLGWQPYVKRVHVREMEGEHTTMFAPPYDAGFAQALQEILNN